MNEQNSLQLGLECLKAQQVDEAIRYFEKATAEFPTDYRGFNFLGIAYARKGFYDRAVGALLSALHLRDDIPSIHYNLGLAYQSDGFRDRAREEFQKALGLDPSYTKAVEALKALETEEQQDDWLLSQACARHVDEPAVGLCSFCHLPVCAKCKTVVKGETFCPTCAPKQ